jgi:hypothetical protein
MGFFVSCRGGVWGFKHQDGRGRTGGGPVTSRGPGQFTHFRRDEALVDVGDDTAARDRRLDERVQLLVAANRELKVAGRDALHLKVLGGIAGELEHLGGQVLEDGGAVDRGGRADALGRRDAALEETVDTSDGELRVGEEGENSEK